MAEPFYRDGYSLAQLYAVMNDEERANYDKAVGENNNDLAYQYIDESVRRLKSTGIEPDQLRRDAGTFKSLPNALPEYTWSWRRAHIASIPPIVISIIEAIVIISLIWGPIIVQNPANVILYWLLLCHIPVFIACPYFIVVYVVVLRELYKKERTSAFQRRVAWSLIIGYTVLEGLAFIGAMISLIWRLVIMGECSALSGPHDCKTSIQQNVALSELILVILLCVTGLVAFFFGLYLIYQLQGKRVGLFTQLKTD